MLKPTTTLITRLTTAACVCALLAGCASAPSAREPRPMAARDAAQAAALAAAIDGDPNDGLTVTGGQQPYVEIVGGIFENDDEALEAAVAALDAYSAEFLRVALARDPDGADFDDLLTPAMERQVRDLLERKMFDGNPAHGEAIDHTQPFMIERTEHDGAVRVHFAVCRVETVGAIPVLKEVAVAAVSTPESPKHLRIDSMQWWVGDSFCHQSQ